MKIKLIIISLFVFVYISVSGQSGNKNILKDGVYVLDTGENLRSIRDSLEKNDSIFVIPPNYEDSTRQLIIKNYPSKIKSYYLVSDTKGGYGYVGGTTSEYNFWLKKKNMDFYSGKNKNINLKITSMNEDTVEVEILAGRIRSYFSGGAYMSKIIKKTPETMKLTYVRALTVSDEVKLIMGPEELKDKIEVAVKQEFMGLFHEYGKDSIYYFALSMNIGFQNEITFSSYVNTLKDIDGLIDNNEDLHFKYDISEWRFGNRNTDSFTEISEICSDEIDKREDNEKAIRLFRERLSESCLSVLEKLKSEHYFEQITGDEIFLIYTTSDLEFNKRGMKKIVNRLNDNKYKDEYLTWMKLWKNMDN